MTGVDKNCRFIAIADVELKVLLFAAAASVFLGSYDGFQLSNVFLNSACDSSTIILLLALTAVSIHSILQG
jgi:hypothetical protein